MERTIDEDKIIDVHTHCGGIDSSRLLHLRHPTCQNLLDLDAKRAANRVEYMVTFPMPNTLFYDTRYYWDTGIFRSSGFCEFPFQLENELLMREVTSFGTKHILPFAAFSLHAEVNKQQRHIEELAKQYTLYGLKYHTVTDQKNALAIESESDFLSIAADWNIPILVHTDATGFADSTLLLELASRHTNVRFCAAHFGGFSKKLFEALQSYPYDNFFLDTAPLSVLCSMRAEIDNPALLKLPFREPLLVFKTYMECFPNRILWGSDEPWTVVSNLDSPFQYTAGTFGYEKEVDLLRSSGYATKTSANAMKFLFG